MEKSVIYTMNLLQLNDEGFLTDHMGQPQPAEDAIALARHLLRRYETATQDDLDRQDFYFIQSLPINDQGDGNVARYYKGNWWPSDEYREKILAMREDMERREASAERRRQKALEPKKPRPGFVYVMTDGEFFKIGITKDVDQRRRGLQGATGREITLCLAYWVQDASRAERSLHNQYASTRQKGEWFQLTSQDLVDIANMLEELS